MIEDRITYAAAMEFVEYVRSNSPNLCFDPEISRGPVKHFLHRDAGYLLQVLLINVGIPSVKMNLYTAAKSSQPFIGVDVAGKEVVVSQAGLMRAIKSEDLANEVILFANALSAHLHEKGGSE